MKWFWLVGAVYCIQLAVFKSADDEWLLALFCWFGACWCIRMTCWWAGYEAGLKQPPSQVNGQEKT